MTSAARAAAIVVAAGSGQRMGGVAKAFLPLLGRPLVCYALTAFEATPEVDAIILVLPADAIEAGERTIQTMGLRKKVTVCGGGATRRDSVRNGLHYVAESHEWTVVHDGARPCVTPEMVSAGIRAAQATGAALAAVPVQDTIKEVGPGGAVLHTLDRSRLYAAQTPQVFATRPLRQAHEQAPPDVVLDDASLLEALGWPVHVYPGDPSNIKVTTAADLVVAEAVLRSRGVPPGDGLSD